MSLFVRLARAPHENVVVILLGRERRVFVQRDERGLVPERPEFLPSPEAARADVERIAMERTAEGYREVARLDGSPWTQWFSDAVRFSSKVRGDAEDTGREVQHTLLWLPGLSPEEAHAAPAEWRDVLLFGRLRHSFRISRGGTYIDGVIELGTASSPTFSWLVRSGSSFGPSASGQLEADGLLCTRLRDGSEEVVRRETADELRRTWSSLVRNYTDGWVGSV